jgi:hypothetical protein
VLFEEIFARQKRELFPFIGQERIQARNGSGHQRRGRAFHKCAPGHPGWFQVGYANSGIGDHET